MSPTSVPLGHPAPALPNLTSVGRPPAFINVNGGARSAIRAGVGR
jgi:hypothetical protein